MHLDFGLRRQQSWIFVIAAVSRTILRVDFLAHCGLLVDLKNKHLIDAETRLFSIGIVASEAYSSISTISCDLPFRELLGEFVAITRPIRFTGSSKHGVQHDITTNGPPIAERAHRLSTEKFKAAKRDFEFMVAQGTCRPSNSQWASQGSNPRSSRPCLTLSAVRGFAQQLITQHRTAW